MKNKRNIKPIIFDYSKLRGRIVEKYGQIKNFAAAMELPTSTVSQYLNNHYSWKQYDVMLAAEKLDIATEDIPKYFYTPLVQSD